MYHKVYQLRNKSDVDQSSGSTLSVVHLKQTKEKVKTNDKVPPWCLLADHFIFFTFLGTPTK